jgi:fructose-1,6-bisphosphatase I
VIPAAKPEDILQSGRGQLVAGYAAYGPQTTLLLSVGRGVQIFTLNAAGDYVMTAENVTIPSDSKEFAINAARRPSWDDVVVNYIDGSIAGGHNMRWVASMVADAYRIFNRGGIFMYPADRAKPGSGRLRLLYEANPIGFLVEAAGGAAIAGKIDILDIQPTSLHQRVPVIFGSKNEVAKISAAYHEERVAQVA